MLYLYKRRGTDEHNLLKPTFNSQEELNNFLLDASKSLSLRGETEAASFLVSIEFEAYDCNNRFRDEFIVLKFSVSSEDYKSWEEAISNKGFDRTFDQIASCVTEVGEAKGLLPVGFVTCHLDRSRQSGNSPYINQSTPVSISNQAFFTFKDGRKIVHERLNFRSKAEIKIFDALVRKGLLVFPLPVAVMGRRRQYREPDFVVCYKGKAGILQVHGGKWHPPETAAQEHELGREFSKLGVSIYEIFDADRCSDNPDGVVDDFLQAFTRP